MSGSGQQEPLHVVIWAAKENASSLHSALKTLGWHYPLAQSKANHTGEIGFPCRQEKECSTNEIEALNALFDSPWKISLESVQTIGPSVNPHERLKDAVMTWHGSNGLVETDVTSYPLPQKWELLGDLVASPSMHSTPRNGTSCSKGWVRMKKKNCSALWPKPLEGIVLHDNIKFKTTSLEVHN